MPDNLMRRFPCTVAHLEAIKMPIQMGAETLDHGIRSLSLGFDLCNNLHKLGVTLSQRWHRLLEASLPQICHPFAPLPYQALQDFSAVFNNFLLTHLKQLHQEKKGELEFISLFTEPLPDQDWSEDYDDSRILLDLPSLRLIDISAEGKHPLQNYTVVFAPRAGHHSNVAERVALYLRDQGLTRMALVEQKCADEIPLYIDHQRHEESFESQVAQYSQVLADLRNRTGCPPHLIAICQPGPLLLSTLLLNPHLGKTFGSAGSPMHTEGEKGFLTDFARLMGETYIDDLMRFCGHTVKAPHPGQGRQSFDGAFQVLGFYYLGMDQHIRNFKRLLSDLKKGDRESAARQMAFYRWYHTVHHFPAGFIQDTYKRIFVNNALIRGELEIGGDIVDLGDYPGHVPIWALGGSRDEIAPPRQATGHMDLIDSVPVTDKLNLICNGGHMGLFRSEKILETHYSRIAQFIAERSDRAIPDI
jgi:polyhydroxyalkanoate depolymerase